MFQQINLDNTLNKMSKISIGFTGDFCPWARMETAWKSGNWQNNLEPVYPFFVNNDLNVLDLECPLTNVKDKISKTGPHIKALPETVAMLNYLNCKVVATANNHFKDYGWEGMLETYTNLTKHNISWLGSGANLQEASSSYITIINGFRIALINMTETEWTTTQGANPGCNPIDFPCAILKIQEAKAKQADAIIVILHGGHEHYPLPSPRMKAQFRFMIDAGADAVIGHHTHVISGYEIYKEKPIFYSLGNFCFDWPGFRNSAWNKGMLLRITFEKGKKIGFEYDFVDQNDEHVGVKMLDADKKAKQEIEIKRLNAIIADDIALQKSFQAYCQTLKPVMLSRIQPYRNKYLTALHKRGFLPDLMGKSKQQMLKILTQCESHREVLLAALNKSN